MKRTVIFIAAAILLSSCGQRGQETESGSGIPENKPSAHTENVKNAVKTRDFPSDLKVPAIYSDNVEIFKYVGEHYWDAFFEGSGKTDSLTILGVPDEAVQQAMANFIRTLEFGVRSSTPDDPSLLKESQKMVRGLFDKIESCQKQNPESFVFLKMTEMVEKYLYDPNSPMRNEDLYLPFVKAMSVSECTSDDMRKSYDHEARSCSVNPFGHKAADFKFRTESRGNGSLYGTKAEWTILFFSNPGCNACKTIVDDLKAINGIDDMIYRKKIAILNIYIDEEIEKWREYLHNYPTNWICGYDHLFRLRDGDDYKVRAIPSLYLLDSEKRVILKDAPTERLVEYIENIVRQNL